MALHDKLPIHQTGSQLLTVVTQIHVQMRRGYKRVVGDKIVEHCAEMLDLMALANATKRERRAEHLRSILAHQRAATTWLRVALDLRLVAPKLWGSAVQMLNSIGKQANGWLGKTCGKAPAA